MQTTPTTRPEGKDTWKVKFPFVFGDGCWSKANAADALVDHAQAMGLTGRTGRRDVMVLRVYLRHMTKDFLAWPSLPTTARGALMNEKTVRMANAALEARGLLIIKDRGRGKQYDLTPLFQALNDIAEKAVRDPGRGAQGPPHDPGQTAPTTLGAVPREPETALNQITSSQSKEGTEQERPDVGPSVRAEVKDRRVRFGYEYVPGRTELRWIIQGATRRYKDEYGFEPTRDQIMANVTVVRVQEINGALRGEEEMQSQREENAAMLARARRPRSH